MSAAQPHTSAGDAQKACCCLEFLLQSGERRKLHELGTFYGWLRRIMTVQLATNLCSFKHSFYRAQEKYGTWLACFCLMVSANRWLLKTGGKENKEDKKKENAIWDIAPGLQFCFISFPWGFFIPTKYFTEWAFWTNAERCKVSKAKLYFSNIIFRVIILYGYDIVCLEVWVLFFNQI